MLSCPKLPAERSEGQIHYSLRCSLLREERCQRDSLFSQAKEEHRQLCAVCAEESKTEWVREDARRAANISPPEPCPSRYTYKYKAGTTVSVLPVGQLTAVLNQRPSATVDPGNAEENLLEPWESENRVDLQEWELGERQEMLHAFQTILVAQHEHELALREAACKLVMGGATALDWTSYPHYAEPGLHP
ncbi:hypothetical protein NXY56_006639 [Leishmania guyanensis]|uniref:Uncharacterized protein n=1 Tax=Leishmania guyanensis TaxID=5670 RepID=A0A1E1IUD8_LEIGU|nr:hypothetical protein, unknown function [Leishmania guyanensis]